LHRQAFDPWWAYARDHYLDLAGEAAPEMTTFYYDPQLDVHHRLPVAAALTTAYYAAPQVPDDARRLFDAACNSIGLNGTRQPPLPANRGFGAALILAREWEIDDLEQRTSAMIEASYEPTWDDEQGEFTWGMGLDEPHPRGQFNAFLAAAEAAGPGRWARLSDAPLEACPQIVDVDFPAIALTRAEWIDGNLHLRLAPLRPDPNVFTSFRLVGAEPRNWDVHGIEGAGVELTTTGVNIRVPMIAADVELIRGSY
jgi:hypothetical protein